MSLVSVSVSIDPTLTAYPKPHEWDAPRVMHRLTESFQTLARLPGDRDLSSLRGQAPALFEPIRSFSDAVSSEPLRDPTKWPSDWYKPGPPEPRAIDQMHEAWTWVADYLGREPALGGLILEVAKARAMGVPVTKLARLKKWGSRRTIYRQRDTALRKIVEGLRADGKIYC